MKKIVSEKREIIGKKVKNLRLEGKVPASIYGPQMGSVSISMDSKEFRRLYREAGHSQLIDIEVDGKLNKGLIKEVQQHPVTREIRHASIYAVNMATEIETEVPIRIEGESPAVKNNIGFLSMPTDKVAIHCLPANLPSEIVVDISNLLEIGNGITAGDLNLGEGVALAPSQSPEETIVAVVPPQKEIIEEEPVVAEGEAGAEGAAATEGEAAAEGADEAKE
jgi:large subunit ribosomal protein L25